MPLAVLSIDLNLGVAKLESDSGRAAQIITRDSARMAAAGDRFLKSLQQQADAAGKSRVELLAMRAAQLGVSDAAADSIAKIDAATRVTEPAGIVKVRDATEALGKSAALSRTQLLTLKYTLSDVIASASSGSSLLTILGQQGGQVAQIEGGVGGLARGIVAALTPARIAIGLTAAAAGGLAYAFIEGSRQSKAFADSVTLTGNYAGKTEGRFNELAKNVAASGQVTVAAAREFGQALISTGQVGPQVLEAATAAAAKYGEATGKSAKEVAADYAAMGQDVTKWAAEHNRQLNFISAAQYDQIKTLQDQGRAADAQGIVYDALNKRFSSLDQNLGTIEKTLKAVKGGWSAFWDAAFDVGRAETIEDKIKKAEDAAAALNKRLTDGRANNPAFSSAPALRARDDPANDPTERARIEFLAQQKRTEAAALESDQGLIEQATAQKADTAAITQRAIASKELVTGYLTEAKSASEYQVQLGKLTQAFKDNAAAGTPFSEAQKASALAGLKKKFTDTSALGEGDAQRKADLAKALQVFTESLDRERDALKFHQDELAAIYSAGNLSLEQFYDDRAKTTAAGVAAELDALTKSQDRIRAELATGKFKDPHERTDLETKLNESLAKSANVTRDADHAATLALYDRRAAVKALQDQSVEFYAQLLQLEGNEADAARLRTQQQIAAVAQLAARSSGSAAPITEDALARQVRALQAANDYAEIQRRLGVASSDAARAEETFLLRSQQAGASLLEADTGVYQLRAAALVQLGELADKARALADASTDPKIKAFAEDLALQYAKAADAVDPAITRLRSGADELATSFRGTFDSIASGALTGDDAIKQLGKTVQTTLTKTFISDPLEAALKGGLRKLVDGEGIGSFLRFGTPSAQPGAGIDVAGAGYSPAKDSQSASEAFSALENTIGGVVSTTITQTTATNTATSALVTMAAAAQAAATALATVSTSSGGSFFQIKGGSSGGGGFGTGSNYGNQDYGAFLADGTNYVPYDGMRAVLHKGESVTPAKYNPAAGGRSWGGGGGDQIQIVNNGSPATVQSTQTTTDGDGRRLKKIVIGALREDIGTGGAMSQTLQGKYGVARRNPKRG